MTKTSKESLRTSFTEMDKRLSTAHSDLSEIKSFIKRLSEIQENMQVLEDFSRTDEWMEGYNELHKLFPDEVFESAGEDGIWDASQEFHFLKIKLMKILSDDLYNTIPDFYHEILEK